MKRKLVHISKEQHKMLKQKALDNETSIEKLVKDAIDEKYGEQAKG